MSAGRRWENADKPLMGECGIFRVLVRNSN